MFNLGRFCAIAAIPISISGGSPYIEWKKERKNKKIDDELVHVHIFHRHGDRTPWYPIADEKELPHIWVPKLSQQYTSFNEENNIKQDIGNKKIHSWHNISSRLRGVTLAFKDDNWDISSPTVFDSSDDRYGDRLCSITTDDNKKYPFMGQLTEKGVKQLENVGDLLRKRYIEKLNYLSDIYDKNDSNLFYQSTNLARTIQSADSLLATLYPTHKREIDSSLIPLHVEHETSYLNPGLVARRHCDKLRKKTGVNHETMLTQLDERFDELTKHITDHYSFNDKNIPYHHHSVAFDQVICRSSHKEDIYDKPLPPKIDNEYLDEFGKYMAKIEVAIQAFDRETLKLSWGNVIYKMMEFMNNLDDKLMVISSCHDNSLICMLSAIYGEDFMHHIDEWPDYASYIIFEVWKNNEENKKYVKVIYNGKILNIFNGNDYIYLNDLNQKWKDIMIDKHTDFKNECIC